MRNFSLTIILLLLSSLHMLRAEQINLESLNGRGIYSTQVGGVPEEGVLERVSITLPSYSHALLFASRQAKFDAINQLNSWVTSDLCELFDEDFQEVPNVGKPQNCGFLLMLELSGGGYMVLQPIAGREVMSWIEVKEKNQIDIVCGTMGVGKVEEASTPLFAYARGEEIYELLSDVWSDLLDNREVKGRTDWRMNKRFPEVFKYLGWCSWEQYKTNISEKLLIDAIDSIEESPLPIRWVLVDDGHQDENEKLRTMVSFDLSTSKFPRGWDPVIAKRSDKIRWFGLWHCMYGHWNGMDATHKLSHLEPYLEPFINGAYIVGEDPKGSKMLYRDLVGSIYRPGFDFTKIDVQTRDLKNYIDIGAKNPVSAHMRNAENLEGMVNRKLMGMINCMAQNLPSVFNTKHSVTTRVSIDYQMHNHPKARSHIYQGFQNSAWMGQTVWPDHDMFHSSDGDLGRFMAVSKALSGAPIYLSDAPEDFIEEYVMPLVYDDGELLRPEAPGVPLPGSLFSNPLMGSDPYSVIAPISAKSAVVVAYAISNVEEGDIPITIDKDDYRYADAMKQPYPGLRSVPQEGLIYYDWYRGQGGVLSSPYSFSLSGIEDRIVILSEIESGWSIIGRKDKYLSTVGVKSYKATNSTLNIELHEAGPILIYSNTKLKENDKINHIGNDIYLVDSSDKKIILER